MYSFPGHFNRCVHVLKPLYRVIADRIVQCEIDFNFLSLNHLRTIEESICMSFEWAQITCDSLSFACFMFLGFHNFFEILHLVKRKIHKKITWMHFKDVRDWCNLEMWFQSNILIDEIDFDLFSLCDVEANCKAISRIRFRTLEAN